MSLPAQIGRYPVVGRLAAGGMAEVLLAKLVGPQGFERPVAIKRILPHLAGEEEFVEMFLDEARLISRIQHRNVVSVLELGQEGNELYMAMEYLAGESLHRLTRALSKAGRPLSCRLAAYIASEAASGLHAAHDLRDPDGNLLDVVHRDVSPQNIFITYDGGVKLLDFGIAKTGERIARTQVGHMKGKFAYMAPEAFQGQPLDRRADVFSLGIVLYEMITGQRLFKRETELQIMTAVCNEAIEHPIRARPDCPKELQEVCLRALARSVDERYQTTLAMRQELSTVLVGMGATSPESEDLAELMRDTFRERIESKKSVLRTPRTPSYPPQNPSYTKPTHATRTGRFVLFGMAIIVVAAIGAWAARLAETRGWAETKWTKWSGAAVRTTANARKAGAEAGAVVANESTQTDLRRLEDLEPVSGATAPHAERGPSEPALELARTETSEAMNANVGPAPDVIRDEITLEVRSDPAGARVTIDGTAQGRAPSTLVLARTDQPVLVELELDGYERYAERIVLDIDQRLRVTLKRSVSARHSRSNRTSGSTEKSPFHRFD